jgi:hypothetical protein
VKKDGIIVGDKAAVVKSMAHAPYYCRSIA